MQIRTAPAMQVLYYRTKATLASLTTLVGNVAQELYEAAAQAKLLPSGPVYWFYFGADGQPHTEFTLEIAIPVNSKPATATNFEWKRTPAFKCIAVTHHGDWKQLGETYGKTMTWLTAQGLQMTGTKECREMYINMDFENPVNNITEVQIGIK